MIKNLLEELKYADSNVVKFAVGAMIDEIVVEPKNKNGERIISVKGSYLPFARANMVTPRGRDVLPRMVLILLVFVWWCLACVTPSVYYLPNANVTNIHYFFISSKPIVTDMQT